MPSLYPCSTGCVLVAGSVLLIFGLPGTLRCRHVTSHTLVPFLLDCKGLFGTSGVDHVMLFHEKIVCGWFGTMLSSRQYVKADQE